MGMSASQARLLTLTARLSDLELQAQQISNAKIRLSQESEQASLAYSDALSKEQIKVYSGTTDGTSTYIQATAYNLTTYNAVSSTDKQRFLKTSSGAVVVSSDVATAYTNADSTVVYTETAANLQKMYSTLAKYLDAKLGYHDAASATTAGLTYDSAAVTTYTTNYNTAGESVTANSIQSEFSSVDAYLTKMIGYSSEEDATDKGLTYDSKLLTYFTNCYNGTEGFLNGMGTTSDQYSTSYDSGSDKYYENVYKEVAECGGVEVDGSQLKDTQWLYDNLNSGNLFLSEWDSTAGTAGTGDFVEVSWTSGDSTLQVGTDDTNTAKAEADYEATTAKIETKDQKFDLELSNIDTEHTAVQTEVDSVKKVIEKNIDRSFKVFNA